MTKNYILFDYLFFHWYPRLKVETTWQLSYPVDVAKCSRAYTIVSSGTKFTLSLTMISCPILQTATSAAASTQYNRMEAETIKRNNIVKVDVLTEYLQYTNTSFLQFGSVSILTETSPSKIYK